MKKLLTALILILTASICHAQTSVQIYKPAGNTGGGGLSSSDIDTFSELDAIVTDEGLVNLDDPQTFLNKIIDGNSNTVKMLRHATDCASYTGAVDGQYCWEQDANTLYVCETADVCDTGGEWQAVASGGSPLTVEESDGNPSVNNITAVQFNAAHFAVTDETGGQAQVDSILSPLASALAANPSDCAANEFATAIAANGNLTCAALTDSDIPDTVTIDAATALATNPSDCSANQYATTIAANGDLTCAQVSASQVTNTPNGSGIGSTTVQGAVDELDSEKVPFSGDPVMQSIFTLYSAGLTIADSGDGNPASDTTAPTGNDVYGTCNDADTCNYTPSESGAVHNRTVTIWNVGSNIINIVPSSGILVTCDGGSYPLAQGQSTRIKYVTDAWYEVCESTDWADLRNVPAFRKTLVQLRPQAYEPPASNYATLDTRNSHPILNFDTTTSECAVWTFTLPNWYSGNGVTMETWTIAPTATSGTVQWDWDWERIEATQDIDSDGFTASVNSSSATSVSGTSGVPIKQTVVFTNGADMDSCAAGELCRVKLCRNVGGDNLAEDASLVYADIIETP